MDANADTTPVVLEIDAFCHVIVLPFCPLNDNAVVLVGIHNDAVPAIVPETDG